MIKTRVWLVLLFLVGSFSYGIGVGHYQWFPFAQLASLKDKFDDVYTPTKSSGSSESVSAQKFLSNGEKLAAMKWFESQSLDVSSLKRFAPKDVAKVLTKSVYGFCLSEPQVVNMVDLFQNCKTACGGYSYVLRGLLEYLGYRTRYANLHNIPQQGNHTAVEVLIDGEWGFLDPTFGVYFTENGLATGDLMSLSEIVLHGVSSKNVFRVVDRGSSNIDLPLEKIFTNQKPISEPLRNGTGPLMVSSYSLAEQIEYREQEILLPLEIPLTLDSNDSVSFGTLENVSFQELQQNWLVKTNETLNDEQIYNDVSFNTSFLYNYEGQKISFLKIKNIKPKQKYSVKFNFYTNQELAKVQISNVGKFTVHDFSNPVEIKKGSSIISGTFLSGKDEATFLIRNIDNTGIVRLFGIESKLND